jgi:phosphatidylglycerol:prolipoprotein diacylglycerol transferase
MIPYNPVPELFRIGSVTVYSWGAFVALAFLVCSFLIAKDAKSRKEDPDFVSGTLFYIILGAIIGSRIAYVFLDLPSFLAKPLSIFMLWEGGMVSYGGIIGGVLGAYIYIKVKKGSFLKFADIAAAYIPLGFAIGRIGCFLNWDDYGIASSLPWAVQVAGDVSRHPVQIYLIIADLLMFAILMKLRHRLDKKKGSMFFAFLGVYGALRLIVEPLRYYDTPLIKYSAVVMLVLFIVLSLIYFARKSKRFK